MVFSLERYSAVIDAYLAGLEQAQSTGHDLSEIHSVPSFLSPGLTPKWIDGYLPLVPPPPGASGTCGHGERRLGIAGIRADLRGSTMDRAG
jgi:hypothetical protein